MTKNKNKLFIIIILIFALLSVISISVFGYIHFHLLFGSGDIPFHLRRVVELKDAILHKDFSPYALNEFNGSAVMGMYPYLSILPFSLLLLLTSSIYYSYYIFGCLIIFGALLISFFSSLKSSRSSMTSFLFSIIYGLSSSFIFEIFTNGDMGVATSLVFLPLAIFGFLDLLKGSNNYLKFSFGIILMSYCQIADVSIIIIFLIAWLLFNLGTSKLNKHILINFLKAMALILLLTSIIWIPIIFISSVNSIHTINTTYLMAPSIKLFVENLNLLPVIAIFVSLFYFHKFTNLEKQMYILSLITIVISSKLMPWKYITSFSLFHFLNEFQFTFRFLIIPFILLDYLLANIICKYTSRPKIISIMLVFVVIILQLSTQGLVVHKNLFSSNVQFHNNNDVQMYMNNSNHLSKYQFVLTNNKSFNYFVNGPFKNSDYYPNKSINKLNYIHNDDAIFSNHQKKHLIHVGYNTFKLNNINSNRRVTLPLIHYKFEHLKIYINHHLINYRINSNDLIVLNNLNKGEQNIQIKYIPNVKLLMIKMILYLLGMIWVLLYFVRKLKIKII